MKTNMFSIIVVTRNRASALQECLLSVLEQSYVDLELVIVDNASDDASIKVIETFKDHLDIKLIRNGQAFSPAKARNQAVALATGKYIVFLDSDAVILSRGIFPAILRLMDGKGSIGGLSGKIYYWNRDRIQHLGLYLRSWDGTMDLLADRKNLFAKRQINDSDYLSTCFAVVPKRVLDQVGQFDEYYEWLHEDLDIFYRIKQAGYELIVEPKLEIAHRPSSEGRYYINAPIKIDWLLLNRREMRNRIYFIIKNYSLRRKIIFLGKLFCQMLSHVRYFICSLAWFIYHLFRIKRGKKSV
ncbi:MAG: glycosyltransferase [Candidatus Saganbacteria bacterium]|nr:glycosyltransferase [Candidatus Saganbacteria bacterium]